MFPLIDAFGPIFWPLLACSVLACTLILERSIFYYRAWKNREDTYRSFAASMQSCPSQTKEIRDESAKLQLSELQGSYTKGLKLLRAISSLSPALGLLGTILGVIQAFQSIAHHSGPVTPNLIAGGLWQAMLTTCLGLGIALPCMLMSYLFQSLSERQLGELSRRLSHLSLSLEINKGQEGAKAVLPAAEKG